ncbi:MAG: hypothetical protein PVJ49_19875, partial [Acidobacteriota bacterium]
MKRSLQVLAQLFLSLLLIVVSLGTAPAQTAAAGPGPAAPPAIVGTPATGAVPAQDDPNVTVDPSLLEAYEYRSTGFTRGGRATAVTGVPDDQLTYFAGYTGGGVWKTADAGITWNNISD